VKRPATRKIAKTVPVPVRVPEPLYKELMQLRQERGVAIAELIRTAMAEFVDRAKG